VARKTGSQLHNIAAKYGSEDYRLFGGAAWQLQNITLWNAGINVICCHA